MLEENREAYFLQELKADPGEQHHWSVYADWLEELGDDRGEFLRNVLTIRQAKIRTTEIRLLQRELLAQAYSMDTAWLNQIGFLFNPATFSKGMFAQLQHWHRIVVLRFWASWSGPCRSYRTAFQEAAKDLVGWAAFADLSVDHFADSCQFYGVTSIPTVLVFKHGNIEGRSVGVRSTADLIQLVKMAGE